MVVYGPQGPCFVKFSGFSVLGSFRVLVRSRVRSGGSVKGPVARFKGPRWHVLGSAGDPRFGGVGFWCSAGDPRFRSGAVWCGFWAPLGPCFGSFGARRVIRFRARKRLFSSFRVLKNFFPACGALSEVKNIFFACGALSCLRGVSFSAKLNEAGKLTRRTHARASKNHTKNQNICSS